MSVDSEQADIWAERRHAMVETQMVARGITDARVLEAMRTVPREEFVFPELVEFAYDDIPLPIGEGQTISQPYIVALMTEALQLSPDDRVLEVGTGSGYAAAVLSGLVKEVYTVERLPHLVTRARRCLQTLGYRNVHVHLSNGTLGWPEHAPYDGIVVTAGGPKVPEALRGQLAPGGRLVIPVGAQPRFQRLLRATRTGETAFRLEDLGPVCFVPLVGAEGWPSAQPDRRHKPAPTPPDSAPPRRR